MDSATRGEHADAAAAAQVLYERARDTDPALAAEAGRLAAAAVEPIDDVRSTASYRRFVLERVVEQMTIDLASN